MELVVARYREDLAWLRRVPRAVRVSVYDKSGDDPYPGAQPLPNVGREAHTYLHHIVSRYDALAELTVFSQGKPFDHVPDLHRILRGLAAGEAVPSGFRWLGFLIDWDDPCGARLFQAWSKNPRRHPLPLDELYRRLWRMEPPAQTLFYPSAHFAATAALIRRQPRSHYEKALALSVELDEGAHCFERTWDRVFGVDGIPPAHRGGPFPLFFKPIRRLMDAGGGAGAST